MFEFAQYDKSLHGEAPVSVGAPYEPVGNVAEMSMLAWSEHCSECGEPVCYQSCDLYQARPDRRCRLFTYGLYKNRAFPSLRGYGAEVAFKKWGLMISRGNTSMMSVRRLLWLERIFGIGAPALTVVGSLAFLVTRDKRAIHIVISVLNRCCRWLHRHKARDKKPAAFLLAVYNPAAKTVTIQLQMSIAEAELPDDVSRRGKFPSFETTLDVESGYSRHQLDSNLFEAVTECGLPFDISLIPEGETAPKLVFLAADFVTYTQAPGPADRGQRPGIKCVVWDLDNTLWQGILVENDEVHLKPEMVEFLRHLDKRGILLSIASKNDYDQAWQKLEEFGIAEYFLSAEINWLPKSGNIRRIAKRLNIGLDTLAFVDDSKFELEEVSTALPMVACVNAADIGDLYGHSRFQGSSSKEARNRRKYYKDAVVRDLEREHFGDDYRGFLAACRIVLDISRLSPADLGRVEELVQRTNQLNFSGRKYRREEIQAIIADDTVEKYVLKCSDRFGSYGTVGFSIVRRTAEEIAVLDLMLSCRVQGKSIEQAFFSHLCGSALSRPRNAYESTIGRQVGTRRRDNSWKP